MKRTVLVCLLLVSIFHTGCVTKSQTTRDIISIGNTVGLHAPFNNKQLFPENPQNVISSLLNVLEDRGAQILVTNNAYGLVSWGDFGSSFIAIPTQIDSLKSSSTSGLVPGLAMWHGLVNGTARIKSSKKGTWLYLHVMGRESQSKKTFFSDGTYEKRLLKAVSKKLSRLNKRTNEIHVPDRIGNRLPFKKTQQAATYDRAFSTLFRNIPAINPKDIKKEGIEKVFPVPLNTFWPAFFDVISQYDALVRVSMKDRVILFAQGVSVPKETASGKPFQYVDVILALYAEPRGEEGSTLYLSYLSDNGFSVKNSPDLRSKDEKEILNESKENPRGVGVFLIADQFFGQLATQLFHRNRWKDKLNSRLEIPFGSK